MKKVSEFGQILEEKTDLGAETREKLEQFRELVVAENHNQNLTRLLTPQEFFYGHIQDVLALVNWSSFQRVSGNAPMADYGSGCGVPGMVAALITDQNWVLLESEKKKAEFLENTAQQMGLGRQVNVFAGRGEEYLVNNQVSGVVARAIGPLFRIYSQIRDCSTWNNLFLLKGKRWEEEWTGFQATKQAKELKLADSLQYPIDDPLDDTRKHTLVHIVRS